MSVSSVQPGQACTPAQAATGCAHLTETDSFQIPKDCGQHFLHLFSTEQIKSTLKVQLCDHDQTQAHL